jgi:hypothetical protein
VALDFIVAMQGEKVSLLIYSPCIQKLRFHQLIYRSCSKVIILILAIQFMFLTAIHFSYNFEVVHHDITPGHQRASVLSSILIVLSIDLWVREISIYVAAIGGFGEGVMYKVDYLPSMYNCQKCNCPRKLIMFVNVHWILCFSHWP